MTKGRQRTYWTGEELDSPSWVDIPEEADRMGMLVGDVEIEYNLTTQKLTISDSVDLDVFVQIDVRPIRLMLQNIPD